jgi:hypothetical protein
MSGRIDVTVFLDNIAPSKAILSVAPFGAVGALHSDDGCWHSYPEGGHPAYTPTPEQVAALASVLAAFSLLVTAPAKAASRGR